MNKNLRDKLFNFEAPPSAGLWNKIAQSLDDDTEYSLAERMLQYEATPPYNGWERIVESLDRDNTTVPFRRNFSFLKYAGVAAALIACVLIGFLYLSGKQDRHQLTTASEKESLLQPAPLNNSSEKSDSEDKNDLSKTNETGDGIQALHSRPGYAIRLHPLPSRKSSSAIKNKLSTKLPAKKPFVSSEHLERYIVFSKTTGEAVRLSKKLFGLFACSERDINCEENIKLVQQTMASGSMMASTDFTGMLEALQTMNKEHNN